MQRFLALSFAALTASVAFAEDGMLGTKSDSISALQGPTSSGGSLLQMIIAVIVVFGLMKFLLPKMMAKFGGKLTTGVGSGIKIEESASFPGGTLYLVNVKDRSLLLGVTPTSINTLADLGAVVKNDPGPTFMEFLDSTDGSKAVVTEAPAAEPQEEIAMAVVGTDDEAKIALERLQKLMS
ncbi:MAG: FliO/MopB family protein [Armatimonadetes bacterium]|nr:FliO/MopB family protein [Armatimonadota bacterium]MBS1728343.1 FliO/MopB family protein [Armatimonadota bacterium]